MDGAKFEPTVIGLFSSPEGQEAAKEAARIAYKKLLKGKGKFGTDGSFNPNVPTFGEPFEPQHDAHRVVRNALLETTAYMQGIAFAFQHLDETAGVQEDADFKELFQESHWNRSQMLLNIYYKGQAGCGTGYMTLSQITQIALNNEFRNRKAIRENVTPVFKRFGIWAVDNGNTATSLNFTPGPFLLLFHEQVFTPFIIQQRNQ